MESQRQRKPRRTKEQMAEVRRLKEEKKALRAVKSNDAIRIPVLPKDIPEVDLPEFYAVKRLDKNGKASYKLVNPLTKERNIATRGKKKTLDLVRKEVDEVSVANKSATTLPLSAFSNAEQQKVKRFNDSRKRLDAQHVAPHNRPAVEHIPNKKRGVHRCKESDSESSSSEEEEEEEPPPRRRGRPKKYETAEEAYKAKLAKNAEYKRRDRRKAQQPAEGEGILEQIAKAKDNVFRKGKALKNKAVRTANTLLYGASDFSRQARDMIRKHGDMEITRMDVGRTPVQSAVTTAINVVSMGQFAKNQKELGYDKLFHLFLKLTMGNHAITLEKNEVITIAPFQEREGTEMQNIPLGSPITLNQLISRAKERMGDRFFKYDSAINNCQDFIMNVLQASNIGTPNDFSFIKQKTEELFKNTGKTRGVAKFFTDLGSKFSAITKGAGVELSNVDKNKISGKGMPKFAKGSEESREFMAKLRAMRGKKMTGGSVEGTPVDMKGGALKMAKVKQAMEKMAEQKAESMGGTGVIHHHHHYMEGGSFWKSIGNFALNTVKDVGKRAIKTALPLAGKALGGIAGTKLGGPAGTMLGQQYGGQAGEELANLATSGWGLKNMKNGVVGDGLYAGKGANGDGLYAGKGLFAGKGGCGLKKLEGKNKLAVINPMTGKGVRKGRFAKGSPEAKAWGEKMRALRKK
jgi:hypothetical protein